MTVPSAITADREPLPHGSCGGAGRANTTSDRIKIENRHASEWRACRRCRTFHTSNWRTPRAIAAHATRQNASADQRRMVERRLIEFMARSSPVSPNAIF